ncbi:hypothetical protein SCHPADRAFT_215383 [Schizopora paradoxa]|uniref:Uncharacterized protein n=1 Tax=Schizopora paradoxa TaxID=27342 RepID=A0A0H2RW81_9AGAM|nr:hypothetical protein SCHPADRAFT_215383 [Schizopora paradoxa]
MDGPAPSIITGPKGDSPEELMQFLEAIINTDLKGTKPIPKDEKKAWVTLVLELSEHFLASFPLSGAGIWSTYSEKTKLSLASLEVIQGSASKVPDFLPVHEEDTHIIIARVLAFTFAVASWNQSHSEPCGPPELCPRSVHLKAVGTFEEVVRCLKVIQVPDRGPTQFVEQCLEGIASCMKNSMVDPKSASLLQKFEPIVLNEGKSPVGFRTEVDSAFHFGLSMSDLVFFASCLCSSDIISFPAKLKYYRELCTFTRQLVELLLTQSLIIPSRMRSEALSIVLRAWTHLSTLQGYVSDMVNVIPTTVLLVRLQEGPNADWDATDRELLSIFNKGLTIVPLFNHQVVLRIADQESWGEDGESLRLFRLAGPVSR